MRKLSFDPMLARGTNDTLGISTRIIPACGFADREPNVFEVRKAETYRVAASKSTYELSTTHSFRTARRHIVPE